MISPRQATAVFPTGPTGKRLHVGAIYRYMTVGVRGVVLEFVDGPRKFTSKQAVARFLERLDGQKHAARREARKPSDVRSAREIERELDELGL